MHDSFTHSLVSAHVHPLFEGVKSLTQEEHTLGIFPLSFPPLRNGSHGGTVSHLSERRNAVP